MNASDEWELSKENVQPLKHGRKVASLTAALQPHNVDQHQQLILQRQSMEAALRSYTGDDPLDPWDQYIKWTEQAYPSGGKESNLQVLLEKCVAAFKNEQRYKNDVRYVGCWIKLANSFLDNPLEVFQFMRDQSIGTVLSVFYEAWSWELEQHGNTKKADAVYREGLACNAVPRNALETAHRDFQSRVARAAMNEIQEGINAPPSKPEDQRDHLGDLRAKGRLQKVSSRRIGSAKQASRGGLGTVLPTPQVGQSFSLFCDDENSRGGASGGGHASLPPPTGEWEHIPVRQEAQKENLKGPVPWAGQKIRQSRSAGIAISGAATFARPSFTVHEDESAPDIVTPRKMPQIGSQVLNARKPEKPSNLLENIARQPVADDKTRAMYCKHLIYSGAQEMSLEELRAIRYNARKEAKRIEELRLGLQRQKDEYAALMRQKQEALERQMEQQRMQHEQQLVEQRKAQELLTLQLQQQQQQMQQQLQQMQQGLKLQPSKQPLQVREEVVPLQHGSHGQSTVQDTKPDIGPRNPAVTTRQLTDKDPTVTRQLIYEDTGNQASWMGANDSSSAACNPTPAATYNPTPSSRTALNSSAQITPGAAASNMSQNRTPGKPNNPTPGSSHSRNSSYLNLSRVTPSRTPGGLTRPSPTVNTKEAMGVVMAMLNNPLGEDDDFMLESGRFFPAQRDNDFEDIFANTASKKSDPQCAPTFEHISEPSAFTAFTIFNESAAENNGRELIDGDELEHLDNQENMPPRDFIKPKPGGRQRAGILQPAHGIPFMSLEDQEREAREQDLKLLEETDAMEGIEPLKVLGEEEHPPDVTILNHQDAQSAFKAASRMASTPFTSSSVPSFPPLSSIKPSLGQDPSSLAHDSLVDGGCVDGGGRSVILASRVYAGSQENFEASECTVNTSNQIKLSPIMERSNEDRSSGSSHSSSTGLSSTHPTFSSSHEGLSSTNPGYSSTQHEGLSMTNPGHPGTGLSATHLGVSSAHQGHSVTQSNPHSTSATFSSSTSRKGLVSNTNGDFYTASGPSASAQIKDEYNVSIQHQSQTAYGLSQSSLRHGTSAVDSNMSRITEDQNMDLKHVRNGFEGNISLRDSKKAQPFQIFDDSTNLKLSETSTSKSFQIFEDPSQKQDLGSGDIFHQSAQSISIRETIPAPTSQSHTALDDSVFREYKSFATRPRNGAFETSALETQYESSSVGKPTNPHQSFQVFDDTAPAASLERSLQSSNLKPPSNRPEQQSLHESLMEVHPSEASIHLSTSLMAEMHLNGRQESMMETSQHMNTSLMDYSEVPDDSAAAPGNADAFINPFSDEVIENLLQILPVPLMDYDGYTESDCAMPEVVPDEAVGLNTELYNVEKCIGEGAFAKIYQASILSLYTDDHSNPKPDENEKVVLKVQKQPCPWEFYVSRALHQRLNAMRSPVDVRASLMYANGMHVFPNGSCLVTKMHKNLTLLDAINAYNRTKAVMPEQLLLLFTIEILHVVEQMHACNIIHGDIKPDNFLLIAHEDETESPSGNATMTNTKHIKLIDFGRSIDMQLFTHGTTFTATCNTDGFMCPEMQSGRPWTYQTDLFGVAATVHCLMFGSYMNLYSESGRVKHTSSIKRFYSPCWKNFYDTLLNIPSCDAIPSLAKLRQDLEDALQTKQTNLDLQKMKLFAMFR
ncbi:mitotic checkpoint serine/threonine-protein kinase BUB1-like [Asterias rubens]|uniref:mitotic checkpoint serine/threonine-protein kinase BUB1-like n=1 Tax=Asterias rubens TaxID=7604 RepID=UPI0014553860|nr:mitotic checkpoint serine/threonine-protein kinase BUB1-like [Asterias rubens]